LAHKQRQIERVDFRADDGAAIAARMAHLAGAGDGWINFRPKLNDRDQAPTPLRFMTLFSGGGTGVTMCTWIPGSHDRGEPNPARLGISHLVGRRVARGLATLDLAVPASWFVEQDHPRRGLVVRIPYDEPNEQVLDWAIRVVRALSAPPTPDAWRADVYLPIEP
jgi:hypothetical protein